MPASSAGQAIELVTPMNVSGKFRAALFAAAAMLCAGAPLAQEATTANEGISLELNKLEKSDKGCRAYVVISNPTETAYDTFKLDLVMFQTDGVIGRRFALDLGPVRPNKNSVKLFDLDGASCDNIGEFLVNDVMECRASSGPADDCLARLQVKSLNSVKIRK